MAYRAFLARVGKARPSRTVARSFLALALGMGLFGFAAPGTGGHFAPDTLGDLVSDPMPALIVEAGELVLTASVASLFSAPVFAGPNRAGKADRALPVIDVANFSQGFDAIRLSIADSRANGAPYPGDEVRVAAIDPDLAGAEGLRAIDALEGGADPNAPRPGTVPETLAYGRATEPATEFTVSHAWDEREQWCLATGIYFEARGESYRGQVAVAQVIMNRVAHRNYPDTICGVVYQNQHRRNACQFSFACDGTTNVNRTPEVAAWAQAQAITKTVLDQEIYLTEVSDSTHYHATYVRPHWARNMDRTTQIGLHVFYRFKPGWRFG